MKTRVLSGRYPSMHLSASRRPLLFAAIAAAHLGLLIALVAGRAPRLPETAALRLIAVAATPAAAPAGPALNLETIEPNLPVPPIEVEAEANVPANISAPPAGEVCDIAAAVHDAIVADPSAQTSLAQLPASARSVAGAIMLWDGTWASPATRGEAHTVAALRRVILRTVNGASQSCRDQSVAGPRLIAVPDSNGTTMIAVGSGHWRWADLTG